ncbi:methyl-accepting chemotaxis protein [Halopseudomonas aestusnigri]|uniref:methyl-accepting chemotaxis protein n=1 Tax=Halopseudomonas aestusnigri TaxID=857252 RepID=UPI0028C1777E|nr:methyl-accepting chemotaxis protein CtpL [Halopseudomonas aestusnigri]
MRLKSLTLINTVLLAAAGLALGASLWWSQQALKAPYALMDAYLNMVGQTQSLQQDTEAYRQHGDALRLQQAQNTAAALQQNLQQFPETIRQPFDAPLAEFVEFMQTDLLAIGKLAGDPQALLIQAEREVLAELSHLATYSRDGQRQGAEAAADYVRLIDELQANLVRISLARARLFSQNDPALIENLRRLLATTRQNADELDRLPLLGVVEAQQKSNDPFASLLGVDTGSKASASDPGSDYKRALQSLLNRYPAELERTSALISERARLQQITGERIASLLQGAEQMRPALTAARDRVTAQVRNVQLGIIAMLILIAILIERMQRSLANGISQFAPVLSTYAGGDFTKPVATRSRVQELKQLEHSANQLRQYLIELVTTINQQAEALSGTSDDLERLSADTHDRAAQQQRDTQSINQDIGGMDEAIRLVATNAGESAELARIANREVRDGQQVIGGTIAQMQQLVVEVQNSARTIDRMVAESDTIGSVLEVIQGIAEQTNLLALNAAIEAARAGEAGRGFAVVADEVRGLAQRTAGSTQEIRQLIERLQQVARQSAGQMEEQVKHARNTAEQGQLADAALGRIVNAIERINELAEHIATHTDAQSDRVRTIRENSQQIHHLSEANLGMVVHTRQHTQQISQRSRALLSAVSAFRI